MPGATPQTPVPPGMTLGVIAPRDAIAAFERRKLLQPSFRWQDVWQEEHSRALAVAGVQRLDVLQVFQDALDAKLGGGTSLAAFAKAVRPQLAAKGFWGDVEVTDPQTGETRITRFDDRRLALIYDVNVRQSYATGQWARIERNKARMPFLVYRTMHDERVRLSHQAWDGLVLPVDHPFWRTHYPPNGWRCRCHVIQLDQTGVDRLQAAGKPLKFEAPPEQLVNYVNPRTGEVAAIPRGIDPGFAYNPGQARDEALHEQTLRKAWAASPLAGAVAVAQATFARQEMVTAATARFGAWVDDVATRMDAGQFHARGELQFVGAFQPAMLRKLASAGVQPETTAIAVRDEDIIHTLRDAKAASNAGVATAVYRRLPELLDRATAVLLDTSKATPAVLYVVDLPQANGQVAKLVVQLDQRIKVKLEGKRTTVPLNVVRTVTVMGAAALKDRNQYQVVWGAL
jgi:SPP1 gp7 family putative phage head morphogenesis protein